MTSTILSRLPRLLGRRLRRAWRSTALLAAAAALVGGGFVATSRGVSLDSLAAQPAADCPAHFATFLEAPTKPTAHLLAACFDPDSMLGLTLGNEDALMAMAEGAPAVRVRAVYRDGDLAFLSVQGTREHIGYIVHLDGQGRITAVE